MAGRPPPVGAPTSAKPASPLQRTHRLRYVVVAMVLICALGFLLFKGIGSALNFYLTVNQAVAQRSSLGNRTFNLEGLVEPGSIHTTRTGVNFTVTSGATSVVVHNVGSPPQLFQPDIPVIAVGHFSGDLFASDQILVKHSSTYIAAHPGRVTAPNGTKR
ncbi:MAG: cytochrome c maturation protein CcmE [Acidimicrobiales bacterium]